MAQWQGPRNPPGAARRGPRRWYAWACGVFVWAAIGAVSAGGASAILLPRPPQQSVALVGRGAVWFDEGSVFFKGFHSGRVRLGAVKSEFRPRIASSATAVALSGGEKAQFVGGVPPSPLTAIAPPKLRGASGCKGCCPAAIGCRPAVTLWWRGGNASGMTARCAGQFRCWRQELAREALGLCRAGLGDSLPGGESFPVSTRSPPGSLPPGRRSGRGRHAVLEREDGCVDPRCCATGAPSPGSTCPTGTWRSLRPTSSRLARRARSCRRRGVVMRVGAQVSAAGFRRGCMRHGRRL